MAEVSKIRVKLSSVKRNIMGRLHRFKLWMTGLKTGHPDKYVRNAITTEKQLHTALKLERKHVPKPKIEIPRESMTPKIEAWAERTGMTKASRFLLAMDTKYMSGETLSLDNMSMLLNLKKAYPELAPIIDTIINTHSDEEVTQGTWRTQDTPLDFEMEKSTSITIQFRSMFPDKAKMDKFLARFSPAKQAALRAESSQKQSVLKRMLLLQALGQRFNHRGDVDARQRGKGPGKPWPHPLAMVLSLGNRNHIKGDPELTRTRGAYAVHNFLTTGALDDGQSSRHSGPLHTRYVSSHRVGHTDEGAPLEGKGISLAPRAQKGLDFALGGIGAEGMTGDLVGPDGIQHDPVSGEQLAKQAGHLQWLTTTEGDHSSIIVGNEGSGPLMSDARDKVLHGVGNCFSSSDLHVSPIGGWKWEAMSGANPEILGAPLDDDQIPAKYEGMHISVTSEMMSQLSDVYTAIDAMPEEAQMHIYHNLLSMNQTEALAYLKTLVPVAFSDGQIRIKND